MTFKELTYDNLALPLSMIYETMGYHDSMPDDATVAEVKHMLDEVRQIVRPRWCYNVVNGSHDEAQHLLTLQQTTPAAEPQTFNVGRIVSRQLRGSMHYALFVCTAGREFHAFQERLMAEGDMVRVFIADAIGSCLAETCADNMEATLQQNINKLGWQRTNRFSPGYCGWHVREQQRLFTFFPKEPCGVHLTDSSLMIPIKSVSGVIGLGLDVRYNPYTCGLCDFAKCYKRKKSPPLTP